MKNVMKKVKNPHHMWNENYLRCTRCLLDLHPGLKEQKADKNNVGSSHQ